jgi:DNA sulfur modification protein DndD
MTIDELYLLNFGVYGGEHRLTLTPPDTKRKLVLIGGLNGRGKTTFLDAVLLVLYGSAAKCSNRRRKGYSAFLRECTTRGVTDGGSAVGLKFRLPCEGRETAFEVCRSWQANGKGVREKLSVLRDGADDPALAKSWLEYFETTLPTQVADLFFFDGERIETLADMENAQSVLSAALEGLLGLDVLEQLAQDLEVLQRRKRVASANSAVSSEIEALEAEIAKAEEELDKLRRECAHHTTALDHAELALEKAESDYRRKGGPLYERRHELRGTLQRLQEDVEATLAEFIDIASSEAPLLLVEDLLEQVYVQATAERDRKTSETVLAVLEERDKDLLESLAGEVGELWYAHIERKLTVDRGVHRTKAETESYLGLRDGALTKLFELRSNLPGVRERHRAIAQHRRELDTEISDVERQIEGIPSSDRIGQAKQKCDRYSQTVAESRSALEELETKQAAQQKRLEAARARLVKLVGENIQERLTGSDDDRVLAYARQDQETVARLKTEVLKLHVQAIEKHVSRRLKRLLHKRRLIARVAIDPENCQASLLDAENAPVPPDRLSAGERQLLAVSMLWGLAGMAHASVPVIIDTPLGRLDGPHRQALLTRYFPEASHQVILLSTDQEIDAHAYRELKPFVGHEYSLVFDEDTQTTSIEDGYSFRDGGAN